MTPIQRVLKATFLIGIAFNLTSPRPLFAQMGGAGGTGGGMMDGMISARNGRNSGRTTSAKTPFPAMSGWGTIMSSEDREGMGMGMTAGPYIHDEVLYTLSPNRSQLEDTTVQGLDLTWDLSAYNLTGDKLWVVALESDMLSAPVFAPDGKILLTGREGMRLSFNSGSNSNSIPGFSSSLFVVTPGVSAASVHEAKLDGEWASRPVVVPAGNSYTVYLTSKTVSLGDWDPLQRPMWVPPSTVQSQQFLYAFDSNGSQISKVELK
jgi:hypothetical protein